MKSFNFLHALVWFKNFWQNGTALFLSLSVTIIKYLRHGDFNKEKKVYLSRSSGHIRWDSHGRWQKQQAEGKNHILKQETNEDWNFTITSNSISPIPCGSSTSSHLPTAPFPALLYWGPSSQHMNLGVGDTLKVYPNCSIPNIH